ncbi:MAG: helix-turn-helix transcriptional regulator [Coriobacteriia bacterium]
MEERNSLSEAIAAKLRPENRVRGAKPLGLMLLLVIPLYFVHTIWFQLVAFGTVFSSTFISNITVEQFAMRIAVIIACVLLMVFDNKARSHNNILTPIMSAVLLLGATFLILSANQTLMDQRIMAALGATLTGFGYAWVFLSMFRIFKNSGTMWDLIIVLIVSNALASIAIGAMLIYIPNSILFGIILVSILLNGILLWRTQRAIGIDASPHLVDIKLSLDITRGLLRNFRSLRNDAILLVILSLATAIMRSLNASLPWANARIVATWFNDPMAIMFEIAIYVVVGGALFYAVTHRISETWSQVPFVAMLAGLFVLLFLRANYMDTQEYAIYSMVMEWLLQLTYTFTVVSVMRSLPLTTFQVIGFVTVITSILYFLRVFVFKDDFMSVGLVVIGVVYLTALLISSQRKDNPEAVCNAGSTTGGTATPKLALEERIEQVALGGSLTERETEILGLLARGMNLTSIQKELVIANDTVRTHVKHIYRKLDVHTRQELMGLFL